MRDPLVHLFGPASLLRELPAVVFLQECRASSTIWMPISKTAHPFQYDGFQPAWAEMLGTLPYGRSRALITQDCGIVINDPTWRVIEQGAGENWARVTVELPEPLLEGDERSRCLVLYSVHSVPRLRSLWTDDKAGMSRYFGSAAATPRVIVGADWNAWPDNDLGNTSQYSCTPSWSVISLTLDALDLVDSYRISTPAARR